MDDRPLLSDPDEPAVWRSARQCPTDVAVVGPDMTLSWSELATRVGLVAAALERHAGPSARIGVLGDNSTETLVVYVAALLGGLGVVPVNSHLHPSEIRYVVDDAGLGALWCDRAHLDVATAAGSAHVIVGGRTSERSTTPDHPAVTILDWRRAAGRNLFYTSGTTGHPKGVARDVGLGASVADVLRSLRGHFASGLGPHLVAGPLYHAGPHGAVGLLASGTPVIVAGRFDPERILDLIERHRVATSVMVPTHFLRLLQARDGSGRAWDVSSLRAVGQTGAPCPVDVKRAMIEWFGPVLRASYGATEAGLVSVIESAEWLQRPGSVGRAVAPYTAVVVDNDGGEVEPGCEGRLYFRDATGRGITYRNDPEKTAAAHRAPGEFTLGDVGYVDGEGYIYITGRFSDMVISGGVNIYPAECERVLLAHPAVRDAAIVGLPDEEMGERLHGVVVVDGDVSTDDLLDFCRQRLAHYKVPRDIDITDDLPRSPMGKVDKRALRLRYSPAGS